jgi:vacuolar-type H+-ATPase subunit F/Vma7
MGTPAAYSTRIIAMGSGPLMDGFRLAGVETWPDASAAQLEALLQEMMNGRQRALLLLENELAQSDGPWLRRVRAESGYIVVTQIPPLHLPGDYRTAADALLPQVMGGAETG